MTVVHLPNGPTAYFKLTSVELTKKIFGHARATPHHPELILNNFATRLGHTVGRLFQTFFPPLPEFQGRQAVTLHNQRDFLFFRRHRYAFRSDEKVALQEIGPRFTLKLRSLRKGLPAVKNFGEAQKPLEFDTFDDEDGKAADDAQDGEMAEGSEDTAAEAGAEAPTASKVPPKNDEYEWIWKVGPDHFDVQLHLAHCPAPSNSPNWRLRNGRSSCNRPCISFLQLYTLLASLPGAAVRLARHHRHPAAKDAILRRCVRYSYRVSRVSLMQLTYAPRRLERLRP